MKKQNSFFAAGAVLALSGIAVKALSAAYRIPLTRMLGADTMGRYSAMLNLYMPFFSFATAGITTAVAGCAAVCTDKNDGQLCRIRKTALALYTAVAAALGLFFVVFGKIYADMQQEMLFFYGALALVPSIVLAAAENVFKGVTQGQMNMLPTAQANLLEGTVKTVAGLTGVWWSMNCIPYNREETALMVCFSTITLSGFLCTFFLWVKSKRGDIRTQSKEKNAAEYGRMVKVSAPIGISALTVSLANFFDTAFCLPRIDKLPYEAIVKSFDGASFMGAGDMSMYLFGIWQGMVLTVFNLTPTVVSSVGAASLPLISKSWHTQDKKQLNGYTQKLFRATSALSVPAFVFVFFFGADIVQFLFGTTPQQTVVAGQLMRILCLGGIFCCFVGALNPVLYGAGRADKVFSILLSACVAKSAVGFILCGIPQINIKAFAVSSYCFYTIIFIRSIAAVKKLGVEFDYVQIFAVPLAASAVSVLVVNWLAHTQFFSLPLFLKLVFCGLIYCLGYLLIIFCAGFPVDK